MKKVNELIIPYHDANSYKTTEKSDFFLEMYNCTSHIKRVEQHDCYFVIGEKGAGKTAIALYLEKKSNKNRKSKLLAISTTLYKQFIFLKQKGNLDYTDYESIWRATLLFELAKNLEEDKRFIDKRKLEKATRKYNDIALLPQLNTTIENSYVESLSSALKSSVEKIEVNIGANAQSGYKENYIDIKHSIINCENVLKEVISKVKIKKEYLLFIDGIDARPNDISQTEFYECIQGLANAIWSLNINFANEKKERAGLLRFCLLIRPDIFASLNLYNSNSRIVDNSIYLDWCTTESSYKTSQLYVTVDKYFTSQNNDIKLGWEKYFRERNKYGNNLFFTHLIRYSFQRPRDYFSAVRILINYASENEKEATNFSKKAQDSSYFTNEFSKYLLGEITDYASYYLSRNDFNEYMKFFLYLDGKKRFSWNDFINAFNKFSDYMDDVIIENRDYYSNPLTFLQFLYDINCIGYYQNTTNGKTMYKWAYRERSNSNLIPKVKEGINYVVFQGVMNALDIGASYTN